MHTARRPYLGNVRLNHINGNKCKESYLQMSEAAAININNIPFLNFVLTRK